MPVFTVWAVDGPNDLSNLNNAQYQYNFSLTGHTRHRFYGHVIHISGDYPSCCPRHP